MSRDITKDIYGDLNYAPITLFGNKLNVGIIGAGRGALIKTRNFYNKGSNIEVLALEFLDDFYELDTNRVKLIKGCYKTQFIKNKHIIIIAVSESELINNNQLYFLLIYLPTLYLLYFYTYVQMIYFVL